MSAENSRHVKAYYDWLDMTVRIRYNLFSLLKSYKVHQNTLL